MALVNSTYIWFDSKYRAGGTTSDPIMELEHAPTLSNPNNYFECELLTAEIPFSFNTLEAPVTTLPYTFTVPQHSINVSSSFVLADGNYSILALLDALESAITTAITTAGYPLNKHPTFVFTYDRVTGHATLNMTDIKHNDTFTFTLKWDSADLLAGYFGFTFQQNTVLSYNTSGINTSVNYISTNQVNVSPITSLFLRSDDLNQSVDQQERLVEQFTTVSNILGNVPVNVAYNTWIFYQSNGNFKVKLRNQEITRFNLYWTCLTYEPMNLNGVNFKVQLVFREYQPLWYVELQKEQQKATQARNLELSAMLEQKRKLQDQVETKLAKMRRKLENTQI